MSAVIAAAIGLVTADAWARDATVLILNSSAFAADEKRLVESLRIYTRDTGCRVVIAGEAPAVIETNTLEQVARQARKEAADIVAWTSRRSDGTPIFYVLSVRDLDLRETDISEMGAEHAAETVALKVRTLLSRAGSHATSNDGSPLEPAPAPGKAAPSSREQGAEASAEPLSPETPPVGDVEVRPRTRAELARGPARLPSSAPVGVSELGARADVARPAAPLPSQEWASLGVAYSAAFPVVPGLSSWLRHGLTVTVEARLGHSPVFAYLDGTITTRPATHSVAFDASIRDTPLGAGLLRRWRRERLSFAAGPRATLHVIDVESVSSDGETGSARQLSAGLGALGQVELTWKGRARFYGGLSCEALVPARKFTIAGAPAVQTGAVQFGLSLGVALLIL